MKHDGSAKPTDNRRERRRHRFELEVGVSSPHRFYTGLVRNISAGGLFIQTEADLSTGDEVDVRFTIPGSSHVFEKKAQVRWIRPHDPYGADSTLTGVGVKFLELSDEEAKLLNAFIRDHDAIFYDI